MVCPLDIARADLLSPAGLSSSELQKACFSVLNGAINYADVYLQSRHSESWMLEEGVVKEGHFSIDQGMGIRAISGAKTGLAYSQSIEADALKRAVKIAGSVANANGLNESNNRLAVPSSFSPDAHQLYAPVNPLSRVSEAEKIALLQAIGKCAHQEDERVKQVKASLSGHYEVVLIVDSEGLIAADVRPMVRLDVNVIIEKDNQREQGYAGGGGRHYYDVFFDDNYARALSLAREAVRLALVNLDALPAPAGTMPVVLGGGWPGVLLHEAIGHGLEGDFNRKGSSAFTGKIGQQVAAKDCTIVDDGTLLGRRGSLNIDDEGVPTQYNVLVENGILRLYMQDKLNASLMGVPPTGNGRRQSYAHKPLPRMTNTYMLAGRYAPEEIIASVDQGIYAVNFGGGQVDITSGNFVFSTSEAYLIEKGKVTQPIKGATLIGNGPNILTKVSMIGNNLTLDGGMGTCGKQGQSVPVGVGQPTLKVDALTVGGTSPDKHQV